MSTSNEKTNEKTIISLIRILDTANLPYAIIGGVAVQLWRTEPRTTLDVDVALESYDTLPVKELIASGFKHTGRFRHSDDWIGPDGTPVQFTDEPKLHAAIQNAVIRETGMGPLRVLGPSDLIRAKLLAAKDMERPKSKRLQDLADAQGLLEDNPDCLNELNDEERQMLG